MKLSDSVVSQIKRHAVQEYPNECCGIIKNRKYVPCENLHPQPSTSFRMEPKLLDQAEAIIHSHVNIDGCAIDPRTPSVQDIQSQKATNVPWFIVSVSRLGCSEPLNISVDLDEPLLDRDFVHLVRDCYTLIRSYYWQTYQIELAEFGRDYEWWESDYEPGAHSLYDELFESAGFRKVQEAKPGDLAVMKIMSGVNNHGGVVLPGDQLLHHLVNRKSVVEPIHKWKKYISYYLRHENVNC